MKDLYREYKKSLFIQKEIIKNFTDKLNSARAEYDIKEVRRLKSILRILYEEKNELEEKIHQLRGYISIN